MPLLGMQDVSIAFGGPPVLDRAAFGIERGERVCLLGRNGAGKSTMLKLLDGTMRPDAGEVVRQTGVTVARLEQEFPATSRARSSTSSPAGLGEAGRLLARYHDASHRVAAESERRGAARARPPASRARSAAAWQMQTRVETVLSHLGLDADAPFAAASGGRKRQTLLARALVREPDVLLLDEPTNHLDIEAIEWMEEFLIDHGATLLFVTHDRAFLRRVATRIVELDRGRLVDWGARLRRLPHAQGGGARRRGERVGGVRQEARAGGGLDSHRHPGAAHAQRGTRARARGAARRARRTPRANRRGQAAGAGSRAVRPARGRGARRALCARRARRSSRTSPRRSCAATASASSVPTAPARRRCFACSSASWRPTRARFVSARTSSSRTSISFASSSIPSGACSTASPTARTSSTSAAAVATSRLSRRTFSFPPDRARTPVRALSGGERNRLLLARLFTRSFNLLVLDEPTNDLDIETLDLLEELLLEYSRARCSS